MSKGLVLLAERLLVAEQQAALSLAKAQQDLKLYQQQQDALNQYRQVYHQQWTDRGLQGIPAQQNAQYHAFISKLEQAATQQYEGVLQIREVLTQRREEWLAAQQRRKAVALLLDKQAVRAQQQAQRQEQKMLDEFSLRSRTQHSGL
ncbi:flagellar export protein FliJ [Aeromonas molluscorum]|jgi:flagellar protein FliJ|uniref:Flagellar FliJ protein n=1 Tax=Aeromonas molluscorum 848 TaxID=1268236 RepID=R1GUM5_9GAMM|nr:flagellar export protein FliJ [Aeromonas molluscorum]EOD55320.1 flagellar protein FliJ [Aeromonas molluscorum 848]